MTSEPPPYQVQIDEHQWDEIGTWPEPSQEALFAFLRDHASRTPTAPLPPRLKQLKVPYSGLYQFRVDRQRRFIYRVDEERRLVLTEYVGPHPDWRKSRRRRITP